MIVEDGIIQYKNLVAAKARTREMNEFFSQHKTYQSPDGMLIKPKEFKQLENKYSKRLIVNYFSNYFDSVVAKKSSFEVMEGVLWDAAQLSIAEYLCSNEKEMVVFLPLLACIDHQFSGNEMNEEETLNLDAYFWNSYNRGIAYEDTSLFHSVAVIDSLTPYLLNYPLTHKEITKRYQRLIELSSLPRATKEKYVPRLQNISTSAKNDYYLQY